MVVVVVVVVPPPPPQTPTTATIQTSVNVRNFAELYLRSLMTYHFQIWQFYYFYDALSGDVDGFSTLSMVKVETKQNKTKQKNRGRAYWTAVSAAYKVEFDLSL